MEKIYIISLLFLGLAISSFAQGNVGIGTNSPNSSAKLDIDVSSDASKSGILIPRVTLTGTTDATTISSPATSLLVYNTATAGTAPNDVTPGFYYWDGNWVRIDIKANNGLTKNGDYVQLGGALIQPTTVSSLTATNKMSFTGIGVDAFNIDNNTLSVDATNDKVGIGTNAPKEKLQVAGNILADNNIIATNGIVIGKIERKLSAVTSKVGSSYTAYYQTVKLSDGFGAIATSAYSDGVFREYDGDIKLMGMDISPLLSTTSVWYYTTNNNISVNEGWGQVNGNETAYPTEGNNHNGTGLNQVYCPDGSIVTGWQASIANNNIKGRLHIKCTQLAAGYTTVESNWGVETVLSVPNNTNVGQGDNVTHFSACPTGTFIKGLSIYSSGGYLDGNFRVTCTGIKKTP